MPSDFKYSEGDVSPSGKYVVRNGEWVPRDQANPSGRPMISPEQQTAEMLGGSKIAAAVPTGQLQEPSDAAKLIASGLATAYTGMLGGPLVGQALAAGGRAIGPVAEKILSSPMAMNAAKGGLDPLLHGDIPGAVRGAVMSAAIGSAGDKAAQMLGAASKAAPAAVAAEQAAQEAAPAMPKTFTVPTSQPLGARASIYNAMVKYAKDAAEGYKRGEKIWMELGTDGLPLRIISPNQAAALARLGKATDFVKKIWSD